MGGTLRESVSNAKTDWLKWLQFGITIIALIGSALAYYVSQREKTDERYARKTDLEEVSKRVLTTDGLETKFVTKTDLRLIEQRMAALERSVDELSRSVHEELKRVRDTTDRALGVINQIQIDLARLTPR